MNLLAVGKLEEQLSIAAANFTEGTDSGSFSSISLSTLRYSASRSMQVADGGIVDELMVVSVTVWEDTDSDSIIDNDERQVIFATKVSNMVVYADEAQSS
ncbi:MAG: hypothetical protein COA78_26170 [Blastopirellula sp.]|nr:MAG: hypothetical protein COA78_26170 [Blastopirellula sp.]